MLFIEINFNSALTIFYVKNQNTLQENIGPGLTYDQNRGDPGNPVTGNGGS